MQFHRRLSTAPSTMQADDWWTHGAGETSAQVIYEDTIDHEESSGDGSDGRRRHRYSRLRLPISDDVDYNYNNNDYYYYYYDTQLYDHYDYASGSGAGDVGKFLDLLLAFTYSSSLVVH